MLFVVDVIARASLSLVLVLLVQISRGAGHFLLQLIYRRFLFFPTAPTRGHWGMMMYERLLEGQTAEWLHISQLSEGMSVLGEPKAKAFFRAKSLLLDSVLSIS